MSAAEALAESPVAGLLDRARLLGRVSATVQAISQDLTYGDDPLPPPRCAFDGGTLVITVTTPSQAAKLRQCADRIDQTLRERVPEVTGIRFRLQPGGPNYPMPGMGQPQVVAPIESTPTLVAALQFADDLSAGLHDSPLRESARRLQSRLRKKLAPGR
jgi:hypothetical protein